MRNQRSKNPIATVVYEKGLEMERNQGCCYPLDEINGLEMERNTVLRSLHLKAMYFLLNEYLECAE